jgi:tRNA threonylcarbamoyladenosine biosynthesis protein TsaB
VAQGLAAGAGLRLIGIGSLDALAWNAGGGSVLALLDARMGEIYCAAFLRRERDVCAADAVRVLAPADLNLPEGPWLAAGNALSAYPELAARVRAAGISCQPEAMPTAAAVAQLASGRWLREGGLDAADATPFYVRDKVARTTAERLAEGGRA